MRLPTGRAKRLSLLNDSSVATRNRVLINALRLGRRLRELRIAAGLTQTQLGEQTGIGRPNIARIENGRNEPSLTTIERIATACGADLRSIFQEQA